MTEESILSGMRMYANSIEETLNSTFQVRVQGSLSHGEFMKTINDVLLNIHMMLKMTVMDFSLIYHKGNIN